MNLSLPSLRYCSGALALAALLALPLSAAAPPNDVCSGAVVIPPTGPFPYAAATVDTTGTVNDSGDPEFSCNAKYPSPVPAGAVSRSVWYSFTPSATDNYQIDTNGSQPTSTYDTILGLFTGSCGQLVPVPGGCGDDTLGSLQSSVQVRLTAGITYYILVSGLGSRDAMHNTILPSDGGQLKLNVSKIAVSYPYSYVIPSVTHGGGIALYVSDMNVTNVDSADGSFIVQFLGHGSFGDSSAPSTPAPSSPVTIRANGSVLYPDVLSSALGMDVASNPYGALLIRSTVRLLVGARTYTNASSQAGTFGQYALGVDASGSGIIENGASGRLIGVRDNATARTNLVVFSLTPDSCLVQLELRGASGDLFTGGAQQMRNTPPSTAVQVNGIRSFFSTSDDVDNASIKVTNMTANCKLGAIAYVIDGNSTPGTNDAFAVPLQK